MARTATKVIRGVRIARRKAGKLPITNVRLPHALRQRVEQEAAQTPDTTISDVVRVALLEHFGMEVR